MAFRAVKVVRGTRKSNQVLSKSRQYSNYPNYLLNTPTAKTTTLPSGLRVTTADGIGEIATVGLFAEAGSIFENENNNGVANFVQNVALKGTAKRNKNLEEDAENIGILLSGYTDRETSALIAQSHKDEVHKAFGLLTEFLQNPTFKEADIEKTRNGIRKIQSSLKDKFDESAILDHVHAAAYQGTPYALSPIGESKVTNNLKSSDLEDFVRKYFTAPNIAIVGTGAIKHDELVKLASDSLKSLPTIRMMPPPSVSYVGSTITIEDDTQHNIHSAITFEAVSRSHPHFWSFLVLKELLGHWSWNSPAGTLKCSRLAEILSMEKLAAYFRTFYTPYSNTGLFGVYFEADSGKIDNTVYEIFNDIQKLATYIPENELVRAKNQLKLELISQFENPLKAARNMAYNVLATGRALPLAEQYKRIDDVQISDVHHVINTYLTDVDPVVVSWGSTEEFPDYNIMRGWTYWNRW